MSKDLKCLTKTVGLLGFSKGGLSKSVLRKLYIMLRDEILQTRVNQWFHDSKEYALNNYALCSEWLSEYVINSDLNFILDFFSPEEAEEKEVETMRLQALAWIDQNANDIVNFDDFRGND